MGKGFGFLTAAAFAALLVPYAAEVKPGTGDYEIRSLLFKLKVKSGVDEEGNATKKYSVGFSGMPTRGDVKIIKETVGGGIAKGVDAINKAAEKLSKKCSGGTEKESDAGEDTDKEAGTDDNASEAGGTV